MKINWKFIIFSLLICLIPMILGVVYYSDLPETIAIHWGISGEANSWVSKNLAVFGIPVMLTFFQFALCLLYDYRVRIGKQTKLDRIAKWVAPLITFILYPSTIFIALGKDIDIRIITYLIVGIVFIIFGNYLTKVPMELNKKSLYRMIKNESQYRKTIKMTAVTMIASGFLILVGLFFTPVISASIIVISILIILAISIISICKQ